MTSRDDKSVTQWETLWEAQEYVKQISESGLSIKTQHEMNEIVSIPVSIPGDLEGR